MKSVQIPEDTKYRTSENEAHREEARQQYLDSAGILKNFRW